VINPCSRSIGAARTVAGFPLPDDAIWIDLLSPTADERSLFQKALDVEISDEESLSEIEASSRLKSEHGKLYLLPSASTNTATPI
jgi:Mg2+ and Co2+ transporter CorA